MKEFQKKIKNVVKRHTPDKERIRRSVKEEMNTVVATPKVERPFSVGTLAAIAVMFMLVTGIVIGSVLAEQTRRPAESDVGSGVGSGVGSDSDIETTDTTPQNPIILDMNNVYPLNYQTSKSIPLWEDRTTEEELAERLNSKDIVFADSELSFKESETIEGVVWEARDFDNVTTKELNDTCGCELIWIRGNIFVLEGNTLYLATDRAFTERDDNYPYMSAWPLGHHLMSVHYVPCSIGEKGGIMIHCRWQAIYSGLYGYSSSQIVFYDLAVNSSVNLFTAGSYYSSPHPPTFYEFINDFDLGVELPRLRIPYGMLAIEKREKNVDGASYRILAVKGKGEQYYPSPFVITEVYGYTPVGDLHYDGKMKAWSFEIVDLPQESTDSEVVYSEKMGLGNLSHYDTIENPTAWSDVVDAVLAEKLTFLFSEKTFGAYESRLSRITAENITTKPFYEATGYEMFRSAENFIFLLTDSALYCLDIQGYYDTDEPIVIKNDSVFGMLVAIRTSAEEWTGTVEFYDFKINTFCKLLDSYPYAERVNANIENYQYQIGYHENGSISVLVLNSYVDTNSSDGCSWRTIGRLEYDPKTGAWSQHSMYSLKISELWGDKVCESIALYRHRLDGEQPIKGPDKNLKNRTQIQYVFSLLDTLTITEIPPFAQSLPLTKGWRAVLSPESGKFLNVYFCENYVLIQEARVGGVSYGRFFYLEEGGFERFVTAITNLPPAEEELDDTTEENTKNEDGTHKTIRLMEWDGEILRFYRVLWGDGVALKQMVATLSENGYVGRETDITIAINSPDYDYPVDKGTVWLCFDDALYRIDPDDAVIRLQKDDYLGGGALMTNTESLLEFLKQMERISE